MQEPDEQIRSTTTRTGNTEQSVQEVRRPVDSSAHKQNVAVRIVWFIAGVLLTVLGIRFILVLLGANQSNTFAQFIFDISNPFVSPFFGLFGYQLKYGVSSFEIFTLFAMAIYALVAFGISKLLTITRD